MNSLYEVLLAEMPRIAQVLNHFPENQQANVLTMLTAELKAGFAAGNISESTLTKTQLREESSMPPLPDIETAKKLNRIRTNIFEKTTNSRLDEEAEPGSFKDRLDKMDANELSNVVFYQRGRSIPLSEMI